MSWRGTAISLIEGFGLVIVLAIEKNGYHYSALVAGLILLLTTYCDGRNGWSAPQEKTHD